MTTVDDVIQSALALPLTDRSYVTTKLIESLEPEDRLTAGEITEYDARVARHEAGETKASTSEELDAKTGQVLQRWPSLASSRPNSKSSKRSPFTKSGPETSLRPVW